MKKFFQSRNFIIIALSVLCVAILSICWFISRDKNRKFIPDESLSSTASQEWVETPSETELQPTETDPPAPAPTSKAEAKTEEYPKVVKEAESEKQVVIEFTPTEKPKETTPPAPEGKTIKEDPGPEHPVNAAPDVTAPATEAETNSTPAPGSSNGNGEYYDPVFGWVKPAEVIQSTVDSDGDPNKMVGNMGN